jgi:hypothetical protein
LVCKRGCAWGLIGALLGAPGVTLALELVDPMQPPAAPPMAQEDEPAAARAVWRLRAIKVEAHRRSAMINGRMVAEGEERSTGRAWSRSSRAPSSLQSETRQRA